MNIISEALRKQLNVFFFFSSRRRHTSCYRDWSSDVCSSDLAPGCRGASRFRLLLGVERLGSELAIGLLEENLDASFRLFQLLLAFARKRYALFEKLHGVIQRELRTLQAADDFFKAGKGALEIRLLGRFRFFGSR